MVTVVAAVPVAVMAPTMGVTVVPVVIAVIVATMAAPTVVIAIIPIAPLMATMTPIVVAPAMATVVTMMTPVAAIVPTTVMPMPILTAMGEDDAIQRNFSVLNSHSRRDRSRGDWGGGSRGGEYRR